MNQRIKELAPQCWELNDFGLNFNYEKFAKLIVWECLSTIENSEGDSDYAMWKIKKDFGVEEEKG